EQHSAVAKADMGGLYDHRHAAQHDDFVAPVELVGLSRSEAQRDVRRRRRSPMLLGPSPGVAAQSIIAAVIAAPAELLEDPDQRQLLASRLGRVAFQQFVELSLGRTAATWGRRPLLVIGLAVVPIRSGLFASTADPVVLVVVQLLDGLSGATLGVLTPLIIADLTNGTGRFNLAQGLAGAVS